MTLSPDTVAVLCSGGLDSVVLVAHVAQRDAVQPIYISTGLSWEAAERSALEEVLGTPVFQPRVRPLVALSLPATDLYGTQHWAITGHPPGYDTPDEDVYLPGRNIILLTKAGVFCAGAGIHRLVIGPLAGNPFPDATPAFFETIGRALSLGLAHDIRVEAPFATLHKEDVIRRGVELGVPLARSLSCMNPQERHHCGQCSKCRERHDAFQAAGIEDPTSYATPPVRSHYQT